MKHYDPDFLNAQNLQLFTEAVAVYQKQPIQENAGQLLSHLDALYDDIRDISWKDVDASNSFYCARTAILQVMPMLNSAESALISGTELLQALEPIYWFCQHNAFKYVYYPATTVFALESVANNDPSDEDYRGSEYDNYVMGDTRSNAQELYKLIELDISKSEVYTFLKLCMIEDDLDEIGVDAVFAMLTPRLSDQQWAQYADIFQEIYNGSACIRQAYRDLNLTGGWPQQDVVVMELDKLRARLDQDREFIKSHTSDFQRNLLCQYVGAMRDQLMQEFDTVIEKAPICLETRYQLSPFDELRGIIGTNRE